MRSIRPLNPHHAVQGHLVTTMLCTRCDLWRFSKNNNYDHQIMTLSTTVMMFDLGESKLLGVGCLWEFLGQDRVNVWGGNSEIIYHENLWSFGLKSKLSTPNHYLALMRTDTNSSMIIVYLLTMILCKMQKICLADHLHHIWILYK